MRTKPVLEVERCRIVAGPTASDESYGNNGQFILTGPQGERLLVQVSDGAGWEHASVSLLHLSSWAHRCPTWEEMCFVKRAFWEAEECVVQYHPAESEYVNCHPYVLHLWKPTSATIPTPPSILVGPKFKKDRHGR
jgi:hypothetical protein